jgi:hypothetical protein
MIYPASVDRRAAAAAFVVARGWVYGRKEAPRRYDVGPNSVEKSSRSISQIRYILGHS